MSQTRSCPVCGRPGLLPNCASCPQCDADLTCFQALDSLSSSNAAVAKKTAEPAKRWVPWAALALIVTAVLLLLTGLAVSMKSRLSKLDRERAEMRSEQEKNQEKSVPAPAAIAETKLPPESKIHIDAQVKILDEQDKAAQAAAIKSEAAFQKTAKDGTPNKEQPVAAKEEKKPTVPIETEQAVELKVDGQLGTAPVAEKQIEKVIKEPILSEEELVSVSSAAEKKMQQCAVAQQSEHKELAESTIVTAQENTIASSQGIDEAIPSVAQKEQPVPSETSLIEPVNIRPVQRKRRVPQQMQPAPNAAAVSEALSNPEQPSNPPQAAEPLSSNTFFYSVKDGETAWDIAERFYGDRKYYPVVMEQNPHIFLGFIRKNSTVRLFADHRAAAALYERRIDRQEGLLLWKYVVRPRETWRSIYARFFLPRYSGMVFYGDQKIEAGKTVRIILK